MTTTVLLNLGILAFVLMTGLGTRELNRRRFSLPLAIVAVVGALYPSAGQSRATANSSQPSVSGHPRLAGVRTNRSAPPATVTPVLIYPDVRATVAWLASAFGFEERVRVGEAHRAQLAVGAGGAVIVADVSGEKIQPAAGSVTHIIKVRVADVDAAFARARDAGAQVISEPTTYEYGERSCELADLAGHRWELTESVRDVQPEEWGGVTVSSW